MDVVIQNALYASWLAGHVNTLLEQNPGNEQWRKMRKTNLPRNCFLWVEDETKRSTWHIPYREGAGEIDKKSGYFESAGAVNLNVLRAVAQIIESPPGGEEIQLPAKIKSKINHVLEANKVGRFNDGGEELMEIHESSISAQFVGARLDKENRVVENVTVLGPTSVNHQHPRAKGRRYLEKARQSAALLLEGVKAYTDHATKSQTQDSGGVRSVREILGYYSTGRIDEHGNVRANMHYLKNNAEWFEPLVEEMPDKIGNSIHASGSAAYNSQDLMEDVQDINKVWSIDLVTEPGSTKNLFESKEGNQLDYREISMADLTENRPDLVKAITIQVKESLKDDSAMTDLKEQVKSLLEENKTLKAKQDESDLKERLAAKKEEIAKVLKESKLKDAHITPVFREMLENATDIAGVKKLIEDREKLVMQGTGVRGMGNTEVVESEVKTDFDELTGVKG